MNTKSITKRKNGISTLLVLVAFLMMGFMAKGEDKGWPRTIVDATGKEIVLEKKAERVAILHAIYLDYFFALGTPPIASAGATVGDAMKALNEFETLKPYAGTAEIMDLGSARDLNLESILASKPDVIVTFKTHGNLDKIYDELVKIAPVILLDFSEDWQTTIMRCAEIVGKEEVAKKYIEETEKLIKETREELKALEGKTVAILRPLGKGDFSVIGSSLYVYYDKEKGFGLTMPKDYPKERESISIEGLAEMNPDYIIFQHFAEISKKAVQEYENSSVWQSLEAVKNNHVIYFDDSLNTGSPLAIRVAAKNFLEMAAE